MADLLVKIFRSKVEDKRKRSKPWHRWMNGVRALVRDSDISNKRIDLG